MGYESRTKLMGAAIRLDDVCGKDRFGEIVHGTVDEAQKCAGRPAQRVSDLPSS